MVVVLNRGTSSEGGMTDLSDRVIVVTGGSGNLGRAVADTLAKAGAIRILLDRSPIADCLAASERTLAVGGLNLTDPDALGAVLDRAFLQFGRIDGLVSTVGAYSGGTPVHAQGWADWSSMLTANLQTTVIACQAVVPRLLDRGGRIVGARGGVAGSAGAAAYAASKAGVMRLTESLSEELKDKGINVNCVMPSILDTPQNRAAMPKNDASRWVPPEDVAAVILFLLSDLARSVTGALIPVYGRA
jgi:NAD(P)-dependent dehydrogenase (short-subunit alcohol dehydrogenase family)